MEKPVTLEQVKQQVRTLVGRNILIKVNKGRNKFVEYHGNIESVYPSIFTINTVDGEENKTLSYSYNDVMTHAVRFYKDSATSTPKESDVKK